MKRQYTVYVSYANFKPFVIESLIGWVKAKCPSRAIYKARRHWLRFLALPETEFHKIRVNMLIEGKHINLTDHWLIEDWKRQRDAMPPQPLLDDSDIPF